MKAYPPEIREQAKRLADQGLNSRSIATTLGIPYHTIYRWLNPAYTEQQRQRARARKQSYRGKCIDCGGPTSGCNGPGKAPERCDPCYRAARVPAHGTLSRYQSGCRCNDCRHANRAHKRSLKGRPAPSHGASGYHNYGCRCDVCRAAGSEVNRRRYLKRTRDAA